jgi:F-type H+-transporting ATPase subunit b
MDLVTPSIGLLFWTTISFVTLLLLLKKFAWKPILEAVNTREESISNALNSAEEARKEMANLTSTNEKLLIEAREERDAMMKEARETKKQLVNEAKDKAKEEADKMISLAKEEIGNEKKAALSELKGTVAALSIDIAEKLVKEKLSGDDKQQALVNGLVEEVNLN